jgi:ElaA protein
MTGAGKELMRRSVLHCEALFGKQPIRIGAQKYLKAFYEGFGFKDVGKEYIEDGIPHLEMLRH